MTARATVSGRVGALVGLLAVALGAPACGDAASAPCVDDCGGVARGGLVPPVTLPSVGPAPAVLVTEPGEDCGTASMLADDFAGADPTDHWNVFGGAAAQAEQRDGRAVITLGAAPGFGGFVSRARVALGGAAMRVAVLEVPDTTTNASVSLRLTVDDAHALALQEQAGRLRVLVEDGAETVAAEVAYDAGAHRWWQIREADGTIVWEVSADGVTWDELARMPTPFDVDRVRVDLLAGTGQPRTSPGAAVFDDLNGGLASGRWCDIRAWSDSLTGPDWSERWTSWRNEGCSVIREGGAVVLQPVPNLDTGCGLGSYQPFDFREGVLALEVLASVGHDSAVAQLGIELPGDGFAGFQHVGPHFSMELQQGTDSRVLATVEIDLAHERWWRLRAHDGVLYWETSADSLIWITHAAEPVAAPLDAVYVTIAIVEFHPTPAPGEFRFRRFNQPPYP